MAPNAKIIAVKPCLRSSLLTFGPTVSTLLKFTAEPIFCEIISFKSVINFSFSLAFFSNLIKKSPALPNCLTFTSPNSGMFSELLKS